MALEDSRMQDNRKMNGQQKAAYVIVVLWKAVFPFLAYLAIPSMLLFAVELLAILTGNELGEGNINFYSSAGTFVFLLWGYRRLRRKKITLQSYLGVKKGPAFWKRASYYVLQGISFNLILSTGVYVISGIRWLAPLFTDYFKESQTMSTLDNMQLVFFCLVLLAPIAEEILFRGFMLENFEKIVTTKHAVLLTTAIFALMHGQPVQIIYAAALGFYLAKTKVAENELIYPILIHIGFNLPNIWVYYVNHSSKMKMLIAANEWVNWCYGVIGLGILLVCYRFLKEKKEQD